jgi:predicted HAD superfamily hydrolase
LQEHRTSAEGPNLANLKAPFDLQAYLSGMRRVAKVEYPNRDFWWNLGYTVFGPMTVAYCQWLEDRFRKDKIECAYFFLRDMEIVSEVFEKLFPQERRAFKTKKLLSSRRAFLFPATEFIPDTALGEFGLFASTIPKPAREFLRHLCVNPKDFENEFAIANFSSPEEMVYPGKLVKLFDLFRQEKVMRAVLERSRAERPLLIQYLKQEGFFDHSQVGVVEIGWGGRVQKALQALLNQMQSPVSMNGYYLATFEVFLANNVPNVKHSSFLLHNGQPVDWMRAVSSGLRILENVYTSTNGTLLYFQEDGGVVRPVFSGSGLSDQQVQMLNSVHGGIRQFAADFASRQDCFQFENIPAVMAIEPFLRLALQPSPEEAHVIGELAYTDNFGSNGARKIAGFRPESQTIPDLWKDFEDAPWKQGLINQNNERAQALRCVLWKMDRGVS